MINTYFSASRIGELLAEGTGKTAQSYCLDLALQSIGIRDEFETSAMRHGTVNQHNAFELIIKPKFTSAIWFDGWMPINENCGSSPDVLIDGMPLDVKCPFHVDNYFEQINRPPKKYYYQVQMQMMSTLADTGFLMFYLTKPESFGEDNWQEYPIAINDRHCIFEFKKDQQIHDQIFEKVDEWTPKKQLLIDMLLSAEPMDILTFFEMQKSSYSFRELKNASNLFSIDRFYKCENKFYYIKKK
jgi:hypothetical protein